MLPGDGINEVRHCYYYWNKKRRRSEAIAASLLVWLPYDFLNQILSLFLFQSLVWLTLFHSQSLPSNSTTHTHTHTHTHAHTHTHIHPQIRAGPPRSTFMIARLKSIFLPRNTKNSINMLKRRRKEWARAEKMVASFWACHLITIDCVSEIE